MGRTALIVVAVALLGGCLEASVQTCPDGSICGAGNVCAPGGGCVDPAQLTACAEHDEGEACTLPGIGAGACVGGVCIAVRCGNGVLDPGEACDDSDPEACTPDCALPTCGDGFVQAGEACDTGVNNADDRACTTRCLDAFCGDGFVLAGTEECDVPGENDDNLPCTAVCRHNVCGDGAWWTGVEVCDDGNTASGDLCRGDCQKVELCGDGFVDDGEQCDDGNVNHADGCDACAQTTWLAASMLGGATLATTVGLSNPQGVALDRTGDVYVADTSNHRVLRVELGTGITTRVAGTTSYGFSGDGGVATSAQLGSPAGLAVDGLGDVYIADTANSRIRRVSALTGKISTIAGGGNGLDGGPATAALLTLPLDVAVDGLGNVFIADTENNRVRRVDATSGVITTVAGTGVQGWNGDGDSAFAQLCRPTGIALDGAGGLYIADYCNQRIRFVDLEAETIATVVGGGTPPDGLGDGLPATSASLFNVQDVAVDDNGDIYVTDIGLSRVRRVDHGTGIIDTVAGTGIGGYYGDGGLATDAQVSYPMSIAARAGAFVIADQLNQRVRRVVGGVIDTVAGAGTNGSIGDGGAATSASVWASGTVVAPDGAVIIADSQHARIRRLDPTGVITTIAGTGAIGSGGDGGPAVGAELGTLLDVAIDGAGNVYIADGENHRVRVIAAATGEISTIAGNGVGTFAGEGVAATSASLSTPLGVAVSGNNLYIADTENSRIRRVDLTSRIITTFAGTGVAGYSGENVAATAAKLDHPWAVAVDASGRVLIADNFNNRIRRVTSGTIVTVAGGGNPAPPGSIGDGLAATLARVEQPTDVAAGAGSTFYVASHTQRRIRRVDGTTSIITTVAGSASSFAPVDGLPATSSGMTDAFAVTVAPDGALLISDREVRRVDPTTQVLTTVAGPVDPVGMGPLGQARLVDPRAIVLAAPFTLIAGGSSGTVQAIRGDLAVIAGRYNQLDFAADLARYRGDSFGDVGGVAYDATTSKIYLTEQTYDTIQVVDASAADDTAWTIATLATPAFFVDPTGLYLDGSTLYVADTAQHAIRAIDLGTGAATTIAGRVGTYGFFGDGGDATTALLYRPQAITRCGGDLYVADTGNQRVRRIHDGIITTVLGDGTAASSGEGAPARTFPVNTPVGLACDSFGNLFVTSTTTVRMLPADDGGVVDGEGPVETIYAAPVLPTFCLTGIAVVDDDTLQISDSCSGLLVELWRQPA